MTTTYVASVKWGKEALELQLDPAAGAAGLKAELQARTGVPKERMKLMAKSKGLWKGVLKDDADLAALDFAGVKPPIQMLMMGSATLPVEPVKKTVFLEDLTPEEVAKTVEPSGLVNLGNTCYLNSVTQCLRVIPHLVRAAHRTVLPGFDLRRVHLIRFVSCHISATVSKTTRPLLPTTPAAGATSNKPKCTPCSSNPSSPQSTRWTAPPRPSLPTTSSWQEDRTVVLCAARRSHSHSLVPIPLAFAGH